MSTLSKFRRFKAGNLHDRISDLEFKLFKSELTDEQLDILDKMERRNNILVAIALVIYFIIGIACGVMLGINHASNVLLPLIPVV